MRIALAIYLLALVACGPSRRGTEEEEQTHETPDAGSTPERMLKRIFATAATYSGNLRAAGGEADALASADKLCNQAAEAAELGGTWRAWLSTSEVDAIDRIEDVGPWYTVGSDSESGGGERGCGGDDCPVARAKAFNNKAHLASVPLASLGGNEFGMQGSGMAWTGTSNGGHWSGFDCGGWTRASAAEGTLGSLSDSSWTNAYGGTCSESNRIICIEQ